MLCNPHKRSEGRTTLGAEDAPLFSFANEVCRVLQERFPDIISQQVLRVDFFQHVETGKYYLNEIEGMHY